MTLIPALRSQRWSRLGYRVNSRAAGEGGGRGCCVVRPYLKASKQRQINEVSPNISKTKKTWNAFWVMGQPRKGGEITSNLFGSYGHSGVVGVWDFQEPKVKDKRVRIR